MLTNTNVLTKQLFIYLLLFVPIVVNAQYQLVHTYNSSTLNRILLQDQTEIYSYMSPTNSHALIANANHQLIDTIPLPECVQNPFFYNVRNDFYFGLGLFYACPNLNTPTKPVILDAQGNEKMAFDSNTA